MTEAGMMRSAWLLYCAGASALALAACGGGTTPGGDGGRVDSGAHDLGVADTGVGDTGAVDLGVDAPITMVGTCQPCTSDANCTGGGQCLALPSGVHVCVPACNPMTTPSTCPRSFDCNLGPTAGDGTICVPRGDCCVDGDADGYGDGIACLGADCNDENFNVHPGAAERCNGFDDDCNGLVDDAASDCGDQNCHTIADGTSEQQAPGMCVSTACVAGATMSCGLFACAPPPAGVTMSLACATSCTNMAGVDDDSLCAPQAHCSAGACVMDQPAGGTCARDGDCSSGHCGNGFCCDHGLCCTVASDCGGSIVTTCDDAATCTGSRGMPTCTSNVCGTVSGVPDDSACDATVLANDCGLFTAVYCNGAGNQSTPPCPTTCIVAGVETDSLCDPGAHCDTGACVPNVPDGHVCTENSDCIDAYCANGVCCNGAATGATCCRTVADCPASFGSPAVCDTPTSCQGHRDAAVCSADFKCGTLSGVNDDSACGPSVLASDCGYYPSLYCSGGTDQPLPMCAAMCTSDAECDLDAHCDTGMCVPDLPDGRPCVQATDCISGYCGNGFCCAGSTGVDCCAAPTDCSPTAYGMPSSCGDPANCQGTRLDPVCNGSHQCQPGSTPIPDDTGCGGIVASTCGNYPSVTCTSMADQPAPMCATTCASDADCDASAYCDPTMHCASRGMTGDSCGSTGECSSGLTCVDGVCCTSACTGTCMACNVTGHVGSCFQVPAGTDPSNECAGVSCAAYFTAPMGLTLGAQCDRRQDVTSSGVDCDGGGHCETAAVLCPSQPAGSVQIDCDDVCQTLAGCSGTTSGTCSPYTPPVNSQTCGVGACQRTTAICSGGGQVTCTPGMSSPETCNDVDDNCNGTTDEGLSGDAYEPNNSCSTPSNLGTVTWGATGGTPSSITIMPTVYGLGDVDVFHVHFTEMDTSCGCGTFCGILPCTDEDYGVQAMITVPAMAGSYRVCNAEGAACGLGTCQTVPAGSSGFVKVWHGDSCCIVGSCNAEADFWITVSGVGAPAFECSAYTLNVTTYQGCCNGTGGTCATTTG